MEGLFKACFYYTQKKVNQSMDVDLIKKKIKDGCQRFFFSPNRLAFEQSLQSATGVEGLLISQVNTAFLSLEEEITLVHNYLVDCFSPRFPELASLNLPRLEYLHSARACAGQDDLKSVDFNAILMSSLTATIPSSLALAITLAAATSTGRPLTLQEQNQVHYLANLEEEMWSVRQYLLHWIEERMFIMAPNVTALVGSSLAAQLVAATGSIAALAQIPAGNIQVIGRAQRQDLAGYSLTALSPHAGLIATCDLVRNTDAPWRANAQRLLANKVALAARLDHHHQHSNGQYGKKLREEIIGKLEKLMEPTPWHPSKPIPPPPIEASKRRGGRRVRRQKELYTQTKARQLANRMAFGQAEEEVIIGDNVIGLGQLSGSAGTSSGAKLSMNVGRTPVMDARLREHIKKQSQRAYAGALHPRKPFPISRIPTTNEETSVDAGSPTASEQVNSSSSSKFIGVDLAFPRFT